MDDLNLMPASNIVQVNVDSVSALLFSGFSAVRRLLRERIDTTIDMDFFSRFAALISFFVCRGNRVGFHRYTSEGLNRGSLLTHRVMYSPYVHTSIAFMALCRSLFEAPDDEPRYRRRVDPNDFVLPLYTPLAGDLMSVRGKLSGAGVENNETQTILLVNPNSSDIFPFRK